MIEFTNVTLSSGQKRSIRISDGRIAGVSQKPYRGDGINCEGLVALPALIDPHVHFRAPGGEKKEDWATGYESALAGGVTTVFDMPNTDPPLVKYEDIAAKIKKIPVPCNHFRLWFGATGDNLGDISQALHHPQICGVKIYMGSSTGNLRVSDTDTLRKIFEVCAQEKGIVGIHAEDEELIEKNRNGLGREPNLSDHDVIRNTEVEVSAVQKALTLQKVTGCMVYFCHISTPESLELIYQAKQGGQTVYVEVCPHHLVLDSQRILSSSAGLFKVNPPLRTPKQAARLRLLLPKQGYIDTIASDHAPHLLEEKYRTSYDEVPSGVPGVQTIFPLLFQWVATGKITLEHFVRLTSKNAAKIFHLENSGIEASKEANFVIVAPKETQTIANADIRSKCGWTPYDGMKVQGKIKYLVTQGHIYHESKKQPF